MTAAAQRTEIARPEVPPITALRRKDLLGIADLSPEEIV